jgi:hypothetical protein
MAATDPGAWKGCLKRSCFGCLIVAGVGLGLILVLALITVVRGTPDIVREQGETTHLIPNVDPDTGSTTESLVLDPDQVGHIILDVSILSFTVVAAPAGTPLRLDARYDSGKYELEESMQSKGELGWTYRLSFDRRSMFDFRHSPDNRLELHLPAGTPLVIEGRIGTGESSLDLGGLWIENVDLDVGIGEHKIDFSEPLSSPMSSFKVSGSIGETKIYNLGNASPAEIRIGHSIGEIHVGLDGAWQNDSDVTVRSSIGALHIGLPPEDFALEFRGARVGLGEVDARRARERAVPPEGAPRIRLQASHKLGEVLLR